LGFSLGRAIFSFWILDHISCNKLTSRLDGIQNQLNNSKHYFSYALQCYALFNTTYTSVCIPLIE
jgi:hypothetical protein